MGDDKFKSYQGESHTGAALSSPYPVSRLAAQIDLVDIARELERADEAVNLRVTAKLEVIAEQIRALQAEARRVLETAQHDHALHHARCNFKRIPGQTYHLYRKPDGSTYFSMVAPRDWGGSPPHDFVGSYRLEPDLSWVPADQPAADDSARRLVARLLEAGGSD
jgi:hypothetical protein